MNQNNPSQAIALTFAKAPAKTIDAGTPLSFAVTAAFPEGVRGDSATYSIQDGAKLIAQGDLPTTGEDGALPFSLSSPETAGEHRWRLTIASAANPKGERYEGTLAFAFTSISHATSLAVWDTPSPAIRGKKFRIKVAAKCTSACLLSGETIEVRDETGKLIASAALGDSAWSETASLYWTDVILTAPRTLKLHEWTVRFTPARHKLPHANAEARFTFMVAKEPAHSVSVKVIDKKTKAPVTGAQIRLGLYRAVTGEKGSARLDVSKGEFPLVVTRAGYEIPERSLTVAKDMRIQVVAEKLPEEDPYAAWTA
jgi:hypothetical protein